MGEIGPNEPEATVNELAALATSLGAHLRRQRARGVRRSLASERPPGEAPAEPQIPGGSVRPKPSSAGWLQPQAAPRRRAPERARSASAPPDPARVAALAEADAVRERAKACGDLEALRSAVAGCTACALCGSRTQTVFADGLGTARVMFVGEAPGADEDASGVPFVGRAGRLLTDIVTKGMGLDRSQVYIANVLKCRPPGNRDPSPAEKITCTPWLDRQIELLDPQVIVPLGRHAANHVLETELSMGRLRGQVHERGGRHVVPTFHPAYLLRSPGQKKECWKDIQLAMGLLGLAPPPRPPSEGGTAR